jgi:Ca2+-binding EF-hand superfamily protein
MLDAMLRVLLLALFPASGLVAGPRQDAEPSPRADAHFAVCDLDENGWISSGEARAVLGLDRVGLSAVDPDGNGRLDREEFRAQERRMLELLGAVRTATPGATATGTAGGETESIAPDRPLPRPRAPRRPARDRAPAGAVTARELLDRHDLDESGGLSEAELAAVVAELDRALSAAVLLERLDGDDSGELEARELSALGLLTRRHAGGADAAGELERGRLAPERGHFARLDADGDGAISASDLRELLAPAHSVVRPSTVLAALDANGDGVLSEAEFVAALRDR